MTDQTTTAPAGASADREAAAEIESLLATLDEWGDPESVRVQLGRGATYSLHTRVLTLARRALRDSQRRTDAAREALAISDPTDISTQDVETIARLASNVRTVGGQTVTIDPHAIPIRPMALAAVLRAGLASIVGDATPPAPASPEPAPAPVEPDPEPSRVDDTAAVLDTGFYPLERKVAQWRLAGFQFVALVPTNERAFLTDRVDVDPAWIAASALAHVFGVAAGSRPAPRPEPAVEFVTSPPVSPEAIAQAVLDRPELAVEAGSPVVPERPSAAEAEMSVYAELRPDNPIRAAIARVLGEADGAVDSAEVLVRDLGIAALDAAAEYLRAALRQPRVTPLLVIDPDHTVWTEDSVLGMADRYRRTVADSAADELRIVGRLDSGVRP